MTKRIYSLQESKRAKPGPDVSKGYRGTLAPARKKIKDSVEDTKKKLAKKKVEEAVGDNVLTAAEKKAIKRLAKKHLKLEEQERLDEIFGLSKREKAAKWFGKKEREHHSAGNTLSYNAHKDHPTISAHELTMNHHFDMYQRHRAHADNETDPEREKVYRELSKSHMETWKTMVKDPKYVEFKNALGKASDRYRRANKAGKAVLNLNDKKHPFAEQVEELDEVKKVKLKPGQKMTSREFKAAKEAVLKKKEVKPSKAVAATARRMSGTGLNKKPAQADDENQSYLARLLKGDLGHTQLSNMSIKSLLARIRKLKPSEQEKIIPSLFDPKTGYDNVVRLLKQ